MAPLVVERSNITYTFRDSKTLYSFLPELRNVLSIEIYKHGANITNQAGEVETNCNNGSFWDGKLNRGHSIKLIPDYQQIRLVRGYGQNREEIIMYFEK